VHIVAWTVVVLGSALVVVTAFVLRSRLPRVATDLLLALGGLTIGVGGLLLFDDVSVVQWILTPLLLAVWAVAHARAMFAGAGPLRT
jgi:hypothetical protein